MSILRPNHSDDNRLDSELHFERKPRSFIPRKYLPTIPSDVLNLPTFPYTYDGTKRWCYSCASFKVLDEFNCINSYSSSKHKAKPGGHCKMCAKKRYTYQSKRDQYLRRAYNLSQEEYDLLFFRQGGLCAVCKQPETEMDPYTGKVKVLAVDHNHETDEVRELLCHACNQLLGHIEKDRARVNKLVAYLKRHDT